MDQRIDWSLVLLVFILASQITDVLSGHHHIKLRHERHRRQHGESYLPASFVSDTDEEESGTWGPWSAPSSCSRSCGGGVAFQSRICRDVDESTGTSYCRGAAKRFFSCNVQPCPGPATDFRAEQCAEFNDVPVEGIKYDWIPYTGGANKCELNCMPRGERFFYRHKLSVTDGTPCTLEQNDVCVQGKCRHVGCDLMLGSDAKEDNCRECGGDGSACNTLQGLLDMDDLVVGYNDILLIPAGATNIAISEVRPSNNYLAIRNSTGHYYLNGNWRIDFPRSLRFAGSVFHYERRPKEFAAADIINALGPINEALYIVLLSQDTNVGVKYEYSIPKRFSHQTKPDGYDWVAGEFSECSTTCGGGIKSRLVRCVRRGDGEEGDAELCDPEFEPQGTQSCGEDPCPPKWEIGEWGPCSKKCGSDGEQTREIKCKQLVARGIISTVDDSQCLEYIGPKDIEIQECNKGVECPQWHIGPWKPCDRLCGAGNQTRKITCYKKVNGKISVMDDSNCPDKRPESEKECNLRPCVGVDWVVSAWTGCDFKCGLTHQTRKATCMSLDGEIYPDEQCKSETKPELVTECSAKDKCSFQWYATQWSECSSKCGEGIQSRQVFCGTLPSGGDCLTQVEDEKCDADKKYNTTQECTAEADECKGEWFAGPWSECSKKCGGGDRTRPVFCMKDDKVVPDKDNCDQEDFMTTDESCNEKPCNGDETIPGPGTSITPEDDLVECPDYEDGDFQRVDFNPDMDFQNDDDHSSYINSLQRSINEIMMGDEPMIDTPNGSSEGGSGSGISDITDGLEGSGSTPGDTSTFDTESTDWSSRITTESSLSTEEGSTSSTDAPTSTENGLVTDDPNAEPQTTAGLNFIERDPPPPEDNNTGGEILETITNTDISTSDSTSDDTSVSEPGTTELSTSGDTSESSASTDIISTVEAESTSSGSSITDVTSSTDSASTDLSSSGSTVSSGTETTVSESSKSTVLSTSETSLSSDSDTTLSTDGAMQETSDSSTTESGSTITDEATESGSTGTDETTESGATGTDETTESGSTGTDEATQSGSTGTDEATQSGSTGTDETTESGSTGTDEVTQSGSTGTDETTESGSTGTDEATQSGSTGTDETTESGSTGTDEATQSASTGTDETTESGSTGTDETGTDETTESGSTGTDETRTDETTESGSTGTDEATQSGSTGTDETTESGSTGTDEATQSGSTGTDDTTESGSTETDETTESGSTGTDETTESGSTGTDEATQSGSTRTDETTESGSTGTDEATQSGSTGTDDTTESGSTETDETTESGSTGTDEATQSGSTGTDETTESGSTGTDEATQSGSTGTDETTEPGSTGTDEATQSGSTGTDETTESGSTGTDEATQSGSTGTDETTESGSTGTDEATQSGSTGTDETTESGSTGTDEATQSGSTGTDETTESGSTGTDEATQSGSTGTDETTESGSTGTDESTESGSTGTDESTESGSTGTDETTESGSTGTDETTESGSTSVSGETETTSDTTESDITESYETTDTTQQSYLTDRWTTISEAITSESQPKCRPRKPKKTCKESEFGCCYDGIKAAKGPFAKGCPIPKTCKETEFGCCPDGVSPAAGHADEGCPDSYCSKTLFGCCQDGKTPAEGNDYEGCPVLCKDTEFGCCADNETPAVGKDNLGCCNVTEHGCCPDGIKPATGPDGEGCITEESSTIPYTSTITDSDSTTTESEGDTESTTASGSSSSVSSSTSESSTSESFTSESSTIESFTSETSDITTVEAGCELSEFGCCPDNETPATGNNLEGCHLACENSTFGCCDDGSAPAHGPNKEGCCLSSLHKCCPDNIREALGPDFHGCGCQYATYRCCPDNVTTALGPNNEGCGCQHAPHGCCPNQITAASGPGFEGCPCHTYQFGCCPDGVSVARGPQNQGCGCENTKFKCCSDGVTPAKGENYAGCTCDASKFGCCPDGVEEAQGENFEGCLTVPITPGAACALDKDRGTCSNFSVRWFFDTEYGGCSRFWYGGCDGNENRFKSQEECKEVCVEPKGRDACFLPKIAGPCEVYNPIWYYDAERKQCGQFMYSGCLGNANRFKTREDCEELCVEPDDVDPCEQDKEVGPCEGNFTRWYFNKQTDSCEEFTYGGCKANKNNFATQISCQQQCLPVGRSRVQDVCALDKDTGPCPGSLLRWYYDAKRKSCRQFVFGGCKGNGNKFRTYAACEQRCPVRDSCSLPREVGTCTEKQARWSFDQKENRCMPFYYTGCGGNRNNYETEEACANDCPAKIEQDTCLLPAIMGECHNYTRRWYYDSYDQRCKQFYYGGCGGNGNNFENEQDCSQRCESSAVPPLYEAPAPAPSPDVQDFRIEFCFQPEEHGPCEQESIKWFYDSAEGNCKQFRYGGCGTNGNNFDTHEECEQRCGNVQDVCELPKYVVACGSPERQYYYDSRSDSCVEFEYGGCSGNKNRFGDIASCEKRCRKSTDSPTTPTTTITTTTIAPARQPPPKKRLSPICLAPRDSGPCNEDETAYYYDVAEGGCKAFTYGGCEGNANRFRTIEQCERLCGSFQGQDVCNIPVDKGPCRAAFPKFYFDPITRTCQQFLYGGCDGSANRFSSEDECEAVCVHREEPTPGNTSNAAICKEPVDIGSCEPGKYWRYYYNDERLDCIAFIYTGCGGNLNRFKSYDACRTTCLLPVLKELQPKPEPTNPCELARAECNAIHCQFGKEKYVDADDCTRCRCADPCLNINCQEGTKCAVDRVAQGNELVSQAVCRPIRKPGNCPRLSNSTTCQKECDSDADCERDFKCCSIGCGSSCLEPAPTEPITTPVPTYDPVPYPGAVPAHVETPAEPNIRAQEGGYVIMKCVATGNPRPVITWRKGVTLINNSVSRYSVTVEGSLQIVGLYTTDAGTYTCTVDNHVAAPVRIQYELEITGSPVPHVPVIIGDRNYRVTVNLNSPATLQCRAWGWPRPVISWWHESRMLPVADTHYQYQRDYSLKIHRVSLVDLGVYTCQAYNGINKPSSWSVTLQAPGPVYDDNPAHQKYLQYLIAPQTRPSPPYVRPPPPYIPPPTAAPTTPKPPTYAPYYPERKPSIPGVIDLSPVIIPNKYTAPVRVNLSVEPGPFPVGSEFSIACDVEGFPVPTVTWYKDDVQIQPDNRIRIYGANRLAVSNVVKSDAGNYRCEAVNQYTRDDKSVDVNVEGIYISPYCLDSPFFANCALIVKGKYCQHDYYAKFCCRSCTEAGELPARPPHVNDARRKRRSLLTFF